MVNKNDNAKSFAQKVGSRKSKIEKEDVELSKDQESEVENNEGEDLQKKVSDLELVAKDLNDKLLRSLAESDNLRRRGQQDLEKASKYAISNFATDLVAVMENFYLTVDNMPIEEIEANPKVKNFSDAVIMTKKELTKVFEKNGIKRVNPLNEKFDHNLHEAISRVESEGEEGVVVQVIQSGYLIQDRLIRPALVGVSVKKSN